MSSPEVSGSSRRLPVLWILSLVVLAVAVRLPYLGRPLGPDEAGYLLVAEQWAPGASLYGDYWVDRPPLLFALLLVPARLGQDPQGLRILGLVVVAVSVLLAARLGHLIGGWAQRSRSTAVLAATTAAIFAGSPLLGATKINGELLSLPFVLGSVLAVLSGAAAQRHQAARWTLAGALAIAAAMVKQSMLDGVVAACFWLGWLLWHWRGRSALRGAGAFAGGALVSAGIILGLATLHGTDVRELWDALVAFRVHARDALITYPDATPGQRAVDLAGEFAASGAVVLVLLGVIRGRSRASEPDPLASIPVFALLMLAWQVVAMVAGGNFWSHYLVGTVPSLVLITCAVVALRPRRVLLLGAVLLWATVLALTQVTRAGLQTVWADPQDRAAAFVASHAGPDDTVLVPWAPAVLRETGLPSPYPYLWPLIVDVRDPDGRRLDRLLTGPDRPTWLIVNLVGTGAYGLDSPTARTVVRTDYQPVHRDRDWQVYRLRPAPPE